jgi:hypothetical protein
MTPAAHISAGLLTYSYVPGPWYVKLGAAIVSHIVLDGLAGYHPTEARGIDYSGGGSIWNGDTWQKKVLISANAIGIFLSLVLVCYNPISLLYVAAAGLFDLWYVMRAIWPSKWPILYKWSPHRWFIDWWAEKVWGYRHDYVWMMWLEALVAVSCALILLCTPY